MIGFQSSGLITQRRRASGGIDPETGRLWLTHGEGAAGLIQQTLRFDDNRWSVLGSGAEPPARAGATFGYHRTQKYFVLFGGQVSAGPNAGNWSLNPANGLWTQYGTQPSALIGATAFWDGTRLLKFGGGGATQDFNITEAWDPDATPQPQWENISPSGSPSVRRYVSTWYDDDRGQAFVFGGFQASTSTALGDLFVFDPVLNRYDTVSFGDGPTPRYLAGAVWFPDISEVVLFGGYGQGGGVLTDLWTFSFDHGWRRRWPSVLPEGGLAGFVMDYDPTTGSVFLVTGEGVSAYERRIWRLNSRLEFEEIKADGFLFDSTKIQVSAGASLVAPADVSSPTIIQVPGCESDGLEGFRETATGAARAWHDLAPGSPPPARYFHAAAYDPVARSAIIFGGTVNAGTNFSDTWEFAAGAWAVKSPSTVPPARQDHIMWYDPVLDKIFLHGGRNSAGTTFYGDLYSWDGSDWTLENPTNPPSARATHSVAYDSARGRAYIIGGTAPVTGAYIQEIWYLDSATMTWTEVTLQAGDDLPPLRSHKSAYDPVRDKIVVFGGQANDAVPAVADLYEFDPATGLTSLIEQPTPAPGARYWFEMVFHPDLDGVVLWGGFDGAASPEDTWLWDGSTWTQLNAANGVVGDDAQAGVYDTANHALWQFGGFDNITTFAEVATTYRHDGDLVRYTIALDGEHKWFDGSAWVDSDETYAETNTAEDINSQAVSLSVPESTLLQFAAYLHAPLATEAGPVLSEVELDLDFSGIEPSGPGETLIYGWVLDSDGNPIEDALIFASYTSFQVGPHTVLGTTTRVRSESDGRWELSIVPTLASGILVTITVRHTVDGETVEQVFADKVIPRIAAIEVNDL